MLGAMIRVLWNTTEQADSFDLYLAYNGWRYRKLGNGNWRDSCHCISLIALVFVSFKKFFFGVVNRVHSYSHSAPLCIQWDTFLIPGSQVGSADVQSGLVGEQL
jgi:hypothetical protein